MRGPLESLTAQARQEQITKKLPHRFLPGLTAHSNVQVECQSA